MNEMVVALWPDTNLAQLLDDWMDGIQEMVEAAAKDKDGTLLVKKLPMAALLSANPKLNLQITEKWGEQWRDDAASLCKVESAIMAALIPDVLEKGFAHGVQIAEVTKRCETMLKCQVDELAVVMDLVNVLEPQGWAQYEKGKVYLLPTTMRGYATSVLQ